MNNSVLLWLVLLYCMHAQGTPMACHWMEEGPAGQRERMEPMLISRVQPSDIRSC